MESTTWEKVYREEAEEIAEAVARHNLVEWPHTWPASTHPDGSESGDPKPIKWDPEPEEYQE